LATSDALNLSSTQFRYKLSDFVVYKEFIYIMKKTKIIVPALGMLLLSTAASVTGTVAWFSMNNFVNATQMNIKARAENGIVISNEAKSLWKDSAEASHQTAIAVYPTSTATGATWCHSTSNNANLANTENPYSMVTPTLDADSGAGYVNDNGQAGYQSAKGQTDDEPPVKYEADSAYYLLNSFYIKSSAEALTKTIYVTEVTATGATNSANLDKALRVLIREHGTPASAKVFAPFDGATLSYNSCTAVSNDTPSYTAVTAIYPNAAGNAGKDIVLLADHTIPAYSSETPVQIDIYLYFEGEDENCISANIAAQLDVLNVSVKFGTEMKYTHD
jgi:hypothetical protein